ncbi:unnamed protein product [Candidula unifasciata]|uniref:Uncharacterized protein n=1 Tax=Candidula unifasciata TaxID=100452 RepID=A0A8S4A653_9EUPU|nr:unnamed protein product [Candidula unifasciata]
MGLLYRQFLRCRMILLSYLSHHPRLVCIILGLFLLLLSLAHERPRQILSYGNRFQDSSTFIREQIQQWSNKAERTKPKSVRECKLFSLQPKTEQLLAFHRPSCRRIPPLPGSCDLANEIFFSEPPATCSHQQSFNFCELKKSVNGKWEAQCNETQSVACISPLSVGKIDRQTGALKWEETGTSRKTAEMITSYIHHSRSALRHYGFCFIRCMIKQFLLENGPKDFDDPERNVYDDDQRNVDSDDKRNVHNDERNVFAEQLLILPPRIEPFDSDSVASQKNNFSINIMLIDSVSRQHFFRSLPKTVSVLKEVTSLLDSETTVLDFELVQAVRSRTFESLQVIFSGEIDPSEKPFGTQDTPPQPLKLSYLYGKFKKKGYHTLWIEDLCYLWEWGISKDLHFLNKSSSDEDTWKRLWKILDKNNIDSVEVTLAMCEVLKANHVPDHFHGPDAVCFNGRHQHEYLLEYLQLYQQTLESQKLPYFMFSQTNVGHEGRGRRVQTLDTSLANYIKFTASLQDTLTIIFSDHGNSYGSFMSATQEARIELFHPFMLFVIPNKVAKILGENAMLSLSVNTDRLVSFLDLHYTINHIVDPESLEKTAKRQFPVSRKGLLEPVDVNRTCSDIPRIMPNLCICQNYDTSVANESDFNLFAYFAIGQLNDEIQRQLLSLHIKNAEINSGNTLVAFKNCERLILQGVHNVRRSFDQNRTQTLKMDLHVQKSQVFFVAVSITYNLRSQGDHKTELMMYDRITPYGIFSVCADNIDLSLCICDTSRSSTNSLKIPEKDDLENLDLLPEFDVLVQDVSSLDRCLFLVTVKHERGAVVFLANVCQKRSFIVTAALEADDHLVYSVPPLLPVVLPGGMVVLGLLFAETGDTWTGSVKVSSQVVSDVSYLGSGWWRKS